jgi:predicted PurR-regulated permease PerM
MPSRFEVSYKTLFKIALAVFVIWLVSQIWGIFLMLFIAIILAAALNPLVDRLEKYRLPRGLAILITYIVLWGTLGTLIAAIIPGLIDQTTRLIHTFPMALSRINFLGMDQQAINNQFLTTVGSLPADLLRLIINVFGNLVDVVTTIVISFYLLLERKHLNRYLAAFTGDTSRATNIINDIERRLGSWVRGELILMAAVGVLTYIGLIILGVDIALPLALLAGLLEIVPTIGPIISAIPGVLIATSIHPFIAVATAAMYFLVQSLENNLLVPKIMQKAVGVNPLVSILSLMIGLRLAGPIGAILAIPVVLVAHSIFVAVYPSFKLFNSNS